MCGPTVESCFGFIPLRVGSLILGYISLIGSFILTAILLVGTIGAGAIFQVVKEEAGKDETLSHEEQQALDIGSSVATGVMGFFTCLVGLQFIFSILLVYGVHARRGGFMMAYYVYGIVFVVLAAIGLVIGLVMNPTWGMGISLIVIALDCYFLIVIRSTAVEMDRGGDGGRVYKA